MLTGLASGSGTGGGTPPAGDERFLLIRTLYEVYHSATDRLHESDPGGGDTDLVIGNAEGNLVFNDVDT